MMRRRTRLRVAGTAAIIAGLAMPLACAVYGTLLEGVPAMLVFIGGLLGGLVFLVTGPALIGLSAPTRWDDEWTCAHCGYDLTGTPEAERCPECGAAR